MMRPIAASESEMTKVRAAVRLKRCSLYLVPPNRMERPSPSSPLPMLDPVIDAFTTLVRPLERAMPAMISSAAFPKVALSNPPRPSPTRTASASVARPIQPATGMMPRAEQTNSAVGLMPPGQKRKMTASGTKTRSQSREGLSFRGPGISRLASAYQPVRPSVVAVVPASLFYELCNRTIFRAELHDAVLEMANTAHGTEDQPGAEHNQTEIKEHQRQQERQHLVQTVIARRGDERAQHGERQGEHSNTSAQGSKRSSFLSQENLDFAKNEIVRRWQSI